MYLYMYKIFLLRIVYAHKKASQNVILFIFPFLKYFKKYLYLGLSYSLVSVGDPVIRQILQCQQLTFAPWDKE